MWSNIKTASNTKSTQKYFLLYKNISYFTREDIFSLQKESYQNQWSHLLSPQTSGGLQIKLHNGQTVDLEAPTVNILKHFYSNDSWQNQVKYLS